MHLTMSDIMQYDKSPGKPNCLEGEKLIKSRMLPYCGRIIDPFQGYVIIAYCEMDEFRNKRPHEIRGLLNAQGKILRMTCTCEDIETSIGQCKHIFATLIYCLRHDLDNLHNVTSEEVRRIFDDDFRPKPLVSYFPVPNRTPKRLAPLPSIRRGELEIRRAMRRKDKPEEVAIKDKHE